MAVVAASDCAGCSSFVVRTGCTDVIVCAVHGYGTPTPRRRSLYPAWAETAAVAEFKDKEKIRALRISLRGEERR